MFKYRLVDHAVPAMSQPRRGQVEGGLAIRECTDHARASPDLAQESFEWIVGAHASPVLFREGVIGQRFLDRSLSKLGGPGKTQSA
jgi:hypothetical protein